MNNYDFNIKAIDEAVKDIHESFMDIYFRQMGSLSYLLGQLESLPSADKNRYMALVQRQSDNLSIVMGQFESLVDVMKKIDADGKKIENLSVNIAQKVAELQASSTRGIQQQNLVKKKKVEEKDVEPTAKPEVPTVEVVAEPSVQPVEPAAEVVAEPASQPEVPAAEVVAEPAVHPVEPAVEVVAEPSVQPVEPAAEVVAEPSVQPEAPAAEVVAEPAVQPVELAAEVVVEPSVQPVEPAAEVLAEPAAQPEAPAVEVVAEPAVQPEAPAAEVVAEPAPQPEAPAAEVVAEPSVQPEAPAAEVVVEPSVQPVEPAAEDENVTDAPAVILQPVEVEASDAVEQSVEEENKNYIADTPEKVNEEMLSVMQSIPGMENVKIGPDGKPDLSQILPKEILDKIKSKRDNSLSGVVSAVAAVERENSGVIDPVLPIIAPESNSEVESVVSVENTPDTVIIPTVAPPAMPEGPAISENSVSLGEGIVVSNPVVDDISQQENSDESVIPIVEQAEEQEGSIDEAKASEDEPELRRFVMGDEQPKAILVSEVQYNKLEGSRVTQEALLRFKHVLPEINGVGPSIAIVTDVSTLSDEEKSKTIEAMMADATALYNSGKVNEAQAMYDKISEMNKTLVKN